MSRPGGWWPRLPRWGRALFVLAVLAVAVAVPPGLPPFWQSVMFFPIGIYVLLALGLNIVVGAAGLLDLGYIAFFAVGAYTTALLTTSGGWNPWAALPVAVMLAMLAGVLLGAPTLRLRGDYLAVVTLGFGEIVRIVAQNTESLGEARGITGIPNPTDVAGIEFGLAPLPYYYLTLAAVVVVIAVFVRLGRSRVGRAWAAIREDEDAAEAMGVPTYTMRLWAFAVGASTAGLAGWIFAGKASFINPDNFLFFFSIIILSAVVLGGMGSIAGVVAGGFTIAFLPEYLRDAAAGDTLLRVLNTLTGGDVTDIVQYRTLLFGATLVVVMVFRPQGLIPPRRRGSSPAPAPAGPAATTAPDAIRVPNREGVTGTVMELRDVTMAFGGVVALDAVSLTIERGLIVGIIGPNGAGKTTLFNCITGVFRPTGGDILLDGRPITGHTPHRITRSGVARTFQNIRLFANLTAVDNVMVGADARHATSVPGAVLGLPRHRREERSGRGEAERLLDDVGIGARGGDLAKNLPYGDQRRLEIARALATGSSVVLLDEPAAGANPAEKRALMDLIRHIRDAGVTVVLIEHDVGLVMEVCDRVAVLDFGQKIADGPPSEVREDPRVIEAYLGVIEQESSDDAP